MNLSELLFALPVDLTTSVLALWCGVREIVKLDTAFCGAPTRAAFTEILCSPKFALVHVDCKQESMRSLIEWTSKRKVHLATLLIEHDDNFHLTEQNSDFVLFRSISNISEDR